MNIPIYRAKEKNNNKYIQGFYIKIAQFHTIIPYNDDGVTVSGNLEFSAMGLSEEVKKIDVTTLAIHFPDMFDNKGNKIFASLSEDGKGGDIVDVLDCEEANYVVWYDKFNYIFVIRNIDPKEFEWETDSLTDNDITVVGIQQ